MSVEVTFLLQVRVQVQVQVFIDTCGLRAEQLDKTRKGLKTCMQHNKSTNLHLSDRAPVSHVVFSRF